MTTTTREPLITPRSGMIWQAAMSAGFIAGIVFLVIEMLLVPAFLHGGAWDFPQKIAALVFGPSLLSPEATFHGGAVFTALVVHFALSIVYGLALGAFVAPLEKTPALSMGVIFGMTLYVVNFYFFTAWFPWFVDARNWVTVVAHLAFGLVAVALYKASQRSRSGTIIEGRY